MNRTYLTQAIRKEEDETRREDLVRVWEREYMHTWALTLGDTVIDLGPCVSWTDAANVARARGFAPSAGWICESGDVDIVQDCPVCDRFGHLGIDFVIEHFEDLACEVAA